MTPSYSACRWARRLARGLSAAALAALAVAGAYAQVTVTGRVTGDDGEALIGASVLVTDAPGVGTVTDVDGNFALELPSATESLTFRYVGYQQQVVELAGRTRLDIVLATDAAVLDEVVVVGYGTVAKRDLAGSVEQLGSKNIENVPVTSFDQVLAGQVKGVQFRQGSGEPGGGAEILVRGIGSLSGDGNAPLIVIDGTPYGNYNAQTNNFLSLVNPNDIATITVVRDAAEKAIYGSRASAGLILITTKRGRSTKPTVQVNAYTGLQAAPAWERPAVLTAAELARFRRESLEDAAAARGEEPVIPDFLADPDSYGAGTNWFDAVTQVAPLTNADLSVRGGADGARYAVSANYVNQEGIVRTTGFERYSLRANLDVDPVDWLTVGVDVAPSWTASEAGATTSGAGGFSAYDVITVSRWADPSAPIYDDDGRLTRTTKGVLTQTVAANPLYRMENDVRRRDNRQILTNLKARAELPRGFYLSSSLGGVLRFSNVEEFRSGTVIPDNIFHASAETYFPGRSRIATGRAEERRLAWESQLGYTGRLGGETSRHRLDAFAGYSAEILRQSFYSVAATNLLDENFRFINFNNVDQSIGNNPTGNEAITERTLLSYLGRARYNYAGRYLVTVALRSDGSSKFGPANRFALFPSASVAWRASDEPWFPRGTAVSSLKLEGSAGLSGSNTVRDYEYQGLINSDDDRSYIFDGLVFPGAALGNIPNLGLGWEETEQLDAGLRVGLLRERLVLSGTYYRQLTTGLLAQVPIPRVSGFPNRRGNAGELLNQGVELGIEATPVRADRFIWNVDANLSANRNRVLALGVNDVPFESTSTGQGTQVSRTVVGDAVAQFYGLQITGLFTQEELDDDAVPKYPGAQVGSPKFVDGDGDGVLERGNGVEDDFVKIGDPFPDFIFGLNTDLTYGRWSLLVTSLGEVGSEIMDLQREIVLNTEGDNRAGGSGLGVFNLDRDALDRYRFGDADFGVRPPTVLEPNASNTYRTRSSASVLDGSYWRINTVKVGYDLAGLAARWGWMQGGQVYASVQNALLFSSFPGNPQISRSAASNSLERNVRYGAYPQARTFTVGASLTL